MNAEEHSEIKEELEERADMLYEMTTLAKEESRVVAAREIGLTQNKAAELLDKKLKTVRQQWRHSRHKFENSRRLNEFYGDYFFSDWRA